MSGDSKPHNAPFVSRAVKEQGYCGEVSADSEWVCIKDVGHDGAHGDERWVAPEHDQHSGFEELRSAIELARWSAWGEEEEDRRSYLKTIDNLEEQLQSLEREAEIQNDEAERLHEQLDTLAKIGYELVYDNMHFHEDAMTDPFKAESYVQDAGTRILKITGLPSNIEVYNGSNPARES